MRAPIPERSKLGITTPRPRMGVPACGLLAFALAPPAALAAPAASPAAVGDLTYLGCIANAGANGCERPAHDSLRGAEAVAVSRDGKSVYVGSAGAVTWFKRRPGGALAYRGCVSHGRTLGCRDSGHGSLNDVEDLAVSRDGKSVYAVGYFSDSITRFKRRPGGALAYGGCFANYGAHGCKEPPHNSLGRASGVAVSRDGQVPVCGRDRGPFDHPFRAPIERGPQVEGVLCELRRPRLQEAWKRLAHLRLRRRRQSR